MNPRKDNSPTKSETQTRIRILVGEDDPNDAFLLERAFQLASVPARLQFLPNGREVTAYLEGREPFADRRTHPLPDLLLLDLKMPQMDGFEVLQWLKGRSEFGQIAAIVLSGSDQPIDIDRAYALGAVRYLVKPNTMDTLVQLVRGIEKCWTRLSAERAKA